MIDVIKMNFTTVYNSEVVIHPISRILAQFTFSLLENTYISERLHNSTYFVRVVTLNCSLDVRIY